MPEKSASSHFLTSLEFVDEWSRRTPRLFFHQKMLKPLMKHYRAGAGAASSRTKPWMSNEALHRWRWEQTEKCRADFFSARMKYFDWDKGTPALDQCYKTLKPLYYDYSKFRLNVIILFLRVLNEHSCNTLNDSIERLNPGLSNSHHLLWKS